MKVAALLDERHQNWHQLESLCNQIESRPRSLRGETVASFAALYRAACADLALADAYQLPPNTVNYLHQLVGRAHNQLYRSQGFRFSGWAQEVFSDLPRRLYRDNFLRLAFVVFWGFFLISMSLGYASHDFCARVLGKQFLDQMQEMHAKSVSGQGLNSGAASVGFYVQHNTSIGLQCFALGLLVGVGGLYVTISNAVILGTTFGYMATVPERESFFQFVTAHGPFELTGIIVSAAAGMRLGFALIDTKGYTRFESVRRAAGEALPIAGLGMVLFGLAAMIEGLISPAAIPYWTKASIAIVSSALMVFYFILLGHPSGPDRAV